MIRALEQSFHFGPGRRRARNPDFSASAPSKPGAVSTLLDSFLAQVARVPASAPGTVLVVVTPGFWSHIQQKPIWST